MAAGQDIARLKISSPERKIRDHQGQYCGGVISVIGYCTQCGLGLNAGDAFCTSCGARRPEETRNIRFSGAIRPRPKPPIEARPVFSIEPSTTMSPPAEERVAASPPVRIDIQPAASIKQRAMSWAIDVFLISIAYVVSNGIHELLGVVTLIAGTAAYYIMMIGGPWQGTAGHRLVGLVVLENESRAPIGPRTAGLRLAINAVLVVPFGLGLILNFRMLNGSSRRTLHDVGSGTIVVRTR